MIESEAGGRDIEAGAAAPGSSAAESALETAEAIVLGAGVSGLAAARGLVHAGLRAVVVLEAAAAPGGPLATAERDGFLAELGPNTVQETPALLALAADAGCAADLVPAAAAAHRRYVVHRGRLVALPGGPPGLLATPLLSWRAKARLATEPWRRRGPGPQETVAAFFRRRLGSEALPIADAMSLGVFAGDPEELAIGFAFGRAYDLETAHGSLLRGLFHAARQARSSGPPRAPRRLIACRDGFERLAWRLAAGLDVRYGCAALAAAADRNGFRVTAVRDGRRSVLTAPRLISALPAAATASVLAPLAGSGPAAGSGPLAGRGPAAGSAPSAGNAPAAAGVAAGNALPPADGDRKGGALATFAAIPYAPVAVVALGYARQQVAHALDGFGFLAPHREGRRILGCLFSSSLFPDRAPAGAALLTVMVGGRRRPELVELPDAEIAALAQAELADLLGVRGEPRLALVRRWRPGIPQPDARWSAARDAARALESANPGLAVLGNWLHGVGLPDCARAGWEAGSRAYSKQTSPK
jgi:oxygen-dependent protoporphyrinogen oxidase